MPVQSKRRIPYCRHFIQETRQDPSDRFYSTTVPSLSLASRSTDQTYLRQRDLPHTAQMRSRNFRPNSDFPSFANNVNSPQRKIKPLKHSAILRFSQTWTPKRVQSYSQSDASNTISAAEEQTLPDSASKAEAVAQKAEKEELLTVKERKRDAANVIDNHENLAFL